MTSVPQCVLKLLDGAIGVLQLLRAEWTTTTAAVVQMPHELDHSSRKKTASNELCRTKSEAETLWSSVSYVCSRPSCMISVPQRVLKQLDDAIGVLQLLRVEWTTTTAAV